MLFMKGTPDSRAAASRRASSQILDALGADYAAMDILPDPRIRQELSELSGWPTIPQLFVGGELVGGCDIVTEMFESGELAEALGVEQPAGACSPARPPLRRRRRCRSSRAVAEEGSPEAARAHERHYTVEQANAARPWVAERLERIRDALDELGRPTRSPRFERDGRPRTAAATRARRGGARC